MPATLTKTLAAAAKEAGGELSLLPEMRFEYGSDFIPRMMSSAVAGADLVVALLTGSSSGVFYEAGIAQAMGKPVVFLIEHNLEAPVPLLPSLVLTYNARNLRRLALDFKNLIRRFKRDPKKFSSARLTLASTAPMIDLKRLQVREYENLCFELLTQMGFRRVEWGKEIKEIDVVATLPKKDPDGFEYHELWLIALGRNVPPDLLMDMVGMESDYFIERILRRSLRDDERLSFSPNAPITILIIAPQETNDVAPFEEQLRFAERRMMKRRHPVSFRLRFWNQQQLITLIQQYPQIAYKYFSEEGRAQSKYRKSPDEFYEENVELNERLQASNVALREEREKRVRAERDALWKDVAFKAAHKLGNPVFALETALQGIKRRIIEKPEEALEVAEEMGASIEKAKAIIDQFKSLIRAQESSPRTVDLVPLLETAGRVAQENGVEVSIHAPEKHPPAFVDPVRITECFDELFANSLHWLDKSEKQINISIDVPQKTDLPPNVDGSRKYVRIHFKDNGCGVRVEEKEKIFSPFFTTDPHGTGLGLPMVQRVIEGNGGLIGENGKHGEGACLEILLPQTAAKEKDD